MSSTLKMKINEEHIKYGQVILMNFLMEAIQKIGAI